MAKPPEDRAPSPSDKEPPPRSSASELEEGLDHLTRAVGGVLTQLLGTRYTQVELDPKRPVISPQADRAVERAGARMGRWLRAAGEGLTEHPTDPVAALDHASKHRREEVETREGEAPLAAGARALAGGLYRSTEAVLDVVAPRRPKAGAQGERQGEGDGEPGDGDEMPEDEPENEPEDDDSEGPW